MTRTTTLQHIVIISLIVACCACSKKSDTTTVTTTIALTSISYSGITVTANPLQFASVASGVSNYSWSFGDGSSSTEAAPVHAYTDTGTYTVTLTINKDPLFSRQISLWVGRKPLFTSLLGGARTWRHYAGRSFSGGFKDTSVHENVSVSVTCVDSFRVLFGADTLIFQPLRLSDSVLYFYKSSTNGFSHQTQKTLVYHHSTQDTITYSIFDQLSAGGASYDTYLFP